jgi:hypothetical protein
MIPSFIQHHHYHHHHHFHHHHLYHHFLQSILYLFIDLPVNSSTGKGGFKSLVQLSKELSEFFMISKLPRTEVIKRIWMYIKDNNLQNPNNKKEILCDDKLEKIFKRKKIDMFQMTKVLSTVMK